MSTAVGAMIIKKKIKDFAFSILNKSKFRGFHLFNDLKVYSSMLELSAHTFFDVGANVGQTSKEIRKYFPQSFIHAFEPVDSTFSILRKNLARDRNIKLNNTALGTEEKKITIFLKNNSQINSLLNEVDSSNKNKNKNNIYTQDIKVIRGDDYCKTNELDDIFLLKTDTEGYDLEVLKGFEQIIHARKAFFIFVEVTFEQTDCCHSSFSAVNEYLSQYGYKLVGFYDLVHHGGSQPHLSHCNCLWTSLN